MIYEVTLLLIFSIISLFLLCLKWAIPINKATIIIFISSIISFCVTVIFLRVLTLAEAAIICIFIQFAVFFTIVLFLFYRDPVRTPPDIENSVVSPTDGKIIYIRTVNKEENIILSKKGTVEIHDQTKLDFFSGIDLIQIGVSLVFTDVHINRSPICGIIKLSRHMSGKFLSLRKKESFTENEKHIFIISNCHINVGLILIASRLVRRIVTYINQEDKVKIGQKIGMIKFGSQVDIFLPTENINILNVKCGDYLYGGETIITTYK